LAADRATDELLLIGRSFLRRARFLEAISPESAHESRELVSRIQAEAEKVKEHLHAAQSRVDNTGSHKVEGDQEVAS